MLRLNVNMKSSELTIGEVAAHFALQTHVLRHWESAGLLTPARTTSDRRRYTTDDLYRVASILRAKEAGFSLPDIREILSPEDPSSKKEVLKRRHAQLRTKLERLQSAMALIEAAIACTHEDITTCPNYQSRVRELVVRGTDNCA